MMSMKEFMKVYDRKFGFSLCLPGWWKPYVVLRSSTGDDDAEYALHFLFRYRGSLYGDVLTVLVYRMSLKRWKRYYDDSPLILMGHRDGRVFAAILPEELPHEFVDPDTGEYDEKRFGVPIRLMRRMVNEDAPGVIRSFRFTGPPPRSRVPGPYLAPGVLPGAGCGCGRREAVGGGRQPRCAKPRYAKPRCAKPINGPLRPR